MSFKNGIDNLKEIYMTKLIKTLVIASGIMVSGQNIKGHAAEVPERNLQMINYGDLMKTVDPLNIKILANEYPPILPSAILVCKDWHKQTEELREATNLFIAKLNELNNKWHEEGCLSISFHMKRCVFDLPVVIFSKTRLNQFDEQYYNIARIQFSKLKRNAISNFVRNEGTDFIETSLNKEASDLIDLDLQETVENNILQHNYLELFKNCKIVHGIDQFQTEINNLDRLFAKFSDSYKVSPNILDIDNLFSLYSYSIELNNKIYNPFIDVVLKLCKYMIVDNKSFGEYEDRLSDVGLKRLRGVPVKLSTLKQDIINLKEQAATELEKLILKKKNDMEKNLRDRYRAVKMIEYYSIIG